MTPMNHKTPEASEIEQTNNNQNQPKGDHMPPLEERLLQWQIECLKDLQDTSLSYRELAAKYKRSIDTVTKLKRRFDVERPARAKSGPPSLNSIAPLSPGHLALGIRLNVYRGSKSYTEIGDMIGASRAAVRHMERGIYEVTLTHLMAISKMLGVEIPDLLVPHRTPTVKR